MSLISNTPASAPGSDVLHRILEGLGRIGTGLCSGLVRGTRTMQVARMISVLNSMSDEQLKQIDLDRSDIKKHAEFLMNVPESKD